MNKGSRIARYLGAVALALGLPLAPAVTADTGTLMGSGAGPDELWRFRVSLDSREIGSHEFLVRTSDTAQSVHIRADFDVRILFVNAYSYDHQNQELWRDGCLERLDASTDDNGERSAVRGEVVGQAFAVTRGDAGTDTFTEPCVRSFAYWNPDFLEAEQLLNAQTGELVDVEISRQGQDAVLVNGRSVPAWRWVIDMEEGPITLWYARENGQWLALEAVTEGGRTLRYEPLQLPFELAGDDRRLAAN
jgi:hypothetical protein